MKSYGLYFLWAATCLQVSATVTNAENGTESQVNLDSQVVLDGAVILWGSSFNSDGGSQDFEFINSRSDINWLMKATDIFQNEFNSTESRNTTFLFPMASYEMCAESSIETGSYIKAEVSRFTSTSGNSVPCYVEVILNGDASAGKDSFLFTSANDSTNISKVIKRFDDDLLLDNGEINHNVPMQETDWVTTGKNGKQYVDFEKVAGTAYQSADHFATSTEPFDLSANTSANSSDSYRMDRTTFKDGGCPASSRIDVSVFIDLAALLNAQADTYQGSIKIDFSKSNT